MIDTIIFDLDGTLIDSKYDIFDSLSKAYFEHCAIKLPMGALKIGPPLEEILRGISPQLTISEISEIVHSFRTFYKNSNFAKTKYFEGIIPLLSTLQQRHYHLFIATNKPLLISKRILQVFGIDFFGDNIIAIDSIVGKRLSKAEMLNELVSKYTLNKNNCIFAGDSPSDIEASKQAGILSVAVGYGYSTEEELRHSFPDYYFETVNELSEFLLTTLN